jgi:hypothetical protein
MAASRIPGCKSLNVSRAFQSIVRGLEEIDVAVSIAFDVHFGKEVMVKEYGRMTESD